MLTMSGGVFSTEVRQINLENIAEFKLQQSLLGKIFNYAEIQLTLKDREYRELHGVRSAAQKMERMREAQK